MSRPAAVIIHGTGRMGQELHSAMAGQNRVALQAMVSPHRPAWLDAEIWFPSLKALARKPAVLIDFSTADAVSEVANWCARAGVALVSGTTGLGSGQLEALQRAATIVPVLHAANFSRGVNLMCLLAEQAAASLGTSVNARITEIHHRHKLDAPSGTALALQAAIGDIDVAIESRREDEVVGEHRLLFALPGEDLELRHVAHERSVFARGALQAAGWLVRQPAGQYSARDWIQGEQD